jgi:hypothetical protein
MPQGFETCRADGGTIRTMKMKGGRYMKVCYDKAGKSHAGEMKTGKAKEEK